MTLSINKQIVLFSLILFSIHLSAQTKEIYANKEGAIRGYDAVAYFKDNQALKGKAQYKYDWKGSSWYFATQQNLNDFKANPEKYAPQYGGFCAYAVANGYTYESDPNAWEIVEGKLYLNYDKKVQKTWKTKQNEFIQSANKHWPSILKKK